MKIASKLALALAKSMNVEFLEDLFEVLQPDTVEKNNLGQLLPSRYVGGPNPQCYTKLMSLYKLRGIEAVERIKEIGGYGWYHAYAIEMHPDGAQKLMKLGNLDHAQLVDSHVTPTILRAWSKITRGEDLFIKGLGRFNVQAAIQRSTNYPGVKIARVQSYGYFGTDDACNLLDNKVWLPHILKYYTQWKDFGFAHAHEFYRQDGIADLVESGVYMRRGPAQLYAIIEDSHRRQRAESAAVRGLPLDTPFPTPLKLDIAEGTVTRAVNGMELAEWGNLYKICLASRYYAERAMAGHSAYFKIELPDTPVAICEINVARKRIEQIRGYNNAAVSERVRNLVLANLNPN